MRLQNPSFFLTGTAFVDIKVKPRARRGESLKCRKTFFNARVTRIVVYRGKYVIVVVKISQVSVTERFLTALENVGLIDFDLVD